MKNVKLRILVDCKRLRKKVKVICSIPSIWVSIIIVVLAIAAYSMSKLLYMQGESFRSSIYSNLFAGLVTGFIITLISNIRQIGLMKSEIVCGWLNETHEMILKHNEQFHMLFSIGDKQDEFFEMSYNADCLANDVNERIKQGTFDQSKWIDPPKYFLKHYDYDCMKMYEVLRDLREFILSYGEDPDKRKEVIEEVRQVNHILLQLNSGILNDIRERGIRLTAIKKSII